MPPEGEWEESSSETSDHIHLTMHIQQTWAQLMRTEQREEWMRRNNQCLFNCKYLITWELLVYQESIIQYGVSLSNFVRIHRMDNSKEEERTASRRQAYQRVLGCTLLPQHRELRRPIEQTEQQRQMTHMLQQIQKINKEYQEKQKEVEDKLKFAERGRIRLQSQCELQKKQLELITRQNEHQREELASFRRELEQQRAERTQEQGAIIDPQSMSYQQLLQFEQQVGRVSKGLSSHLQQTLKRVVFEDRVIPTVEGVQEQPSCSICQEVFEQSRVLIELWCGHLYHEGCVLRWLAGEKVCPLCKAQIT